MYTKQLQAAAFAGLLFYVLSNPITYTIVNSLVASVFPVKLSENGKPTGVGLVVHSLVFAAVTFALMLL
jgi:hypothetical protein